MSTQVLGFSMDFSEADKLKSFDQLPSGKYLVMINLVTEDVSEDGRYFWKIEYLVQLGKYLNKKISELLYTQPKIDAKDPQKAANFIRDKIYTLYLACGHDLKKQPVTKCLPEHLLHKQLMIEVEQRIVEDTEDKNKRYVNSNIKFGGYHNAAEYKEIFDTQLAELLTLESSSGNNSNNYTENNNNLPKQGALI